jgi:hypothetical protein
MVNRNELELEPEPEPQFVVPAPGGNINSTPQSSALGSVSTSLL